MGYDHHYDFSFIDLIKLLFTILCFIVLCLLVIGVTLLIFYFLCKKVRKSIQFKNDEEGIVIKIDDNINRK